MTKNLFDMVRGPNAIYIDHINCTMPTYDTRVLLLLNATQELPVDIQREILKYYPRPQVSQRMQGFLDRWKARRTNV